MLALLTLWTAAGGPPVASEMHDRYAAASAARDAVVAGQLEAARAAGAALAAAEPLPALPLGWAPRMAAMDSAGSAVARAADLPAAAAAVAALGGVCGACHAALEAGPSAAPPEAGGDAHAPAAEALWIGLVTAQDDPWVRGSGAIAGELAGPPEAAAALSAAARAAGTRPGAQAYAGLLQTCAGCHAAPP